jgi:hypothetical protein
MAIGKGGWHYSDDREDGQVDFRPSSTSVLVERLGGKPMFSKDALMLGVNPRLTEVDRSFEDTKVKISITSCAMGLPKIVEAEAYSVLMELSRFEVRGVRVEERALFCIYIAGKRQTCPAADINCITKVLAADDPTWTKGRVQKCLWKIYKKTDLDSICPSPVKSYVDHIFAALLASRNETLPAIRIAFGEAAKMAATTKDSFGSIAPRRHAAYLAFLALRDVPWEKLKIEPIEAREIFEAAGVWPKRPPQPR